MTEKSPHFATFDVRQVEIASVGCSHLNQFLAAIIDEVQVPPEFHNDIDLFGAAGGKRLDKLAITKRDGNELAGVLDLGLKWTTTRKQTETNIQKEM